MESRCYLYAVKGNWRSWKESKIIALGKFRNRVPLSYKILCAYGNGGCNSFITGNKTAIVANYNRGREHLLWLLDYLSSSPHFISDSKFLGQVEETKKIFNTLDANFILLESEEIYQLNSKKSKPEQLNETATAAYTKIGETLIRLKEDKFTRLEKILKIQAKIINELINLDGSDYQKEMGIDGWENIVFFEFDSTFIQKRIHEFVGLIKNRNSEGIESARRIVRPEEVDIMIDKYREMESWEEKHALIYLITDNLSRKAKYILLDFLMNAPHDSDADQFAEMRAIILSFFENNFIFSYSKFTYYLAKTSRIEKKVKKIRNYTSSKTLVGWKPLLSFILINLCIFLLVLFSWGKAALFLFSVNYFYFIYVHTSARRYRERFSGYQTSENR